MNVKIEISRELLQRYVSSVEAHNYGFDGDDEVRAVLDAQAVERQEPVAWITKCKLSGLIEQAEPNEKASNPEHWTDAFPVYTSPPAPVAVVLPQRDHVHEWDINDHGAATVCSICGIKSSDEAQSKPTISLPDPMKHRTDFPAAYRRYAKGWNACLDKVKELNQ